MRIFYFSADTKCHFQLADSASYVPTFSGYQDLYASNLQVGAKYASISEIMNSGVCKTEIIQYIDSNGMKKALFENNCSEIIGIRSKELANGKKSHMLSVSRNFCCSYTHLFFIRNHL